MIALIDTNVIVAALAEVHEHHEPSRAVFENQALSLHVAAHSYAEAFTTLTRRGPHAPFRWPAVEALAALESVSAITTLVGLSSAQTLEAMRLYAQGGGIGARIYDYLIGRAAEMARCPHIITWNVGRFRDLIPSVRILSPADLGTVLT